MPSKLIVLMRTFLALILCAPVAASQKPMARISLAAPSVAVDVLPGGIAAPGLLRRPNR